MISFNHVVGLGVFSGEVTDVNASKMIKFVSNTVLGETPKFMDLQLLTVNTAEKLNSVFTPITRAEGLMGNSNWLAARHGIAEVTADRVIKAKAYINYVEILSLKLGMFLSGKIFN